MSWTHLMVRMGVKMLWSVLNRVNYPTDDWNLSLAPYSLFNPQNSSQPEGVCEIVAAGAEMSLYRGHSQRVGSWGHKLSPPYFLIHRQKIPPEGFLQTCQNRMETVSLWLVHLPQKCFNVCQKGGMIVIILCASLVHRHAQFIPSYHFTWNKRRHQFPFNGSGEASPSTPALIPKVGNGTRGGVLGLLAQM